jgi:TRAP-type C4-dicarboxylate transport system permease small subunit
MTRVCDAVARLLAILSFTSLALIVVALAGQVLFRYVLGAALSHSDEIAQTAMVWLTFLGAALLYREHGHVEIDFAVAKLSPRAQRVVFVGIQLAVITAMLLIAVQVMQSRSVMQRVVYGTLQLPKFWLHFFPLLVSATATVLFAVEAVAAPNSDRGVI